MQRTLLNLIIDLVAAFLFLAMIATGYVIRKRHCLRFSGMNEWTMVFLRSLNGRRLGTTWHERDLARTVSPWAPRRIT